MIGRWTLDKKLGLSTTSWVLWTFIISSTTVWWISAKLEDYELDQWHIIHTEATQESIVLPVGDSRLLLSKMVEDSFSILCQTTDVVHIFFSFVLHFQETFFSVWKHLKNAITKSELWMKWKVEKYCIVSKKIKQIKGEPNCDTSLIINSSKSWKRFNLNWQHV